MRSAKSLWLVHNIHLAALLQTIPPSLGSGSDNGTLAGSIIPYDSGCTSTTWHTVMILIEHVLFFFVVVGFYFPFIPLQSRTKKMTPLITLQQPLTT